MDSSLSSIDRKIIDMFLSVDYSWKNILLQQLHSARCVTKSFGNAYYIKFSILDSCSSIHNVPRVPLSIIIEFGCSDNSVEVHYECDSLSFSSTHPSPIECNMHIVNGFIREIEVFSLKGTPLQLENIAEGKKHYLFYCSKADL